MPRFLAPTNIQDNSSQLRNRLCPLRDPVEMAEVSSHLRDYAVAEVIGFVAMLDGHPGISRSSKVETGRAYFQQARGTKANPFTHAIPSDLLLNGERLIKFYRSIEARTQLERAFGMGVMAPEDWESSHAFPHHPRQSNVVDSVLERHRYGGGLVAAFRSCGEAAVSKGVWDGMGKRRHDLDSLVRFIADIYESTWVPLAGSAYAAALDHFSRQLGTPTNKNPERRKTLEQRLVILRAQIRVFERETKASAEVAKSIWKFAAKESWS